jgi:hypothetical protein
VQYSLFAADIALGLPKSPHGIGQVVDQHAAEPGQVFRLAAAAELLLLGHGLQERLLNDVGGIQLATQPRIEL